MSLESCNQEVLNEHGDGPRRDSYVIGIVNALRLREPGTSISIIGMPMSVDSNTQNMWAKSARPPA